MYGCVADFHEVMRQNLRAEAHGNALRALCKKERKLCRKRDRLLVSSVVRELPECGFGIEHHVERKLGESCLDVTRCGGAVAGKYVAPVTLTVHQQILLSHLHESVADGSVAVRMELHGVSHDVSHLVEATVVHALHRVENASLHRFQTVLDVGNGTLKNHVGGVVEKPVLIHSAKMMYGGCVETVHRLIVGVLRRS